MKEGCRFLLLLAMAAQALVAAGVTVRFDPASPEVGPFPTDFLTVPDPAQKTGLRVRLPLPDCIRQPSACGELGAVNQLDGFHLEPRIRIRFSAAVDPDTLRGGIFFVWLDNLTSEEPGQRPVGHRTGINQVIYDPATDTAYAKPDETLDQHRRYALVVTAAVRDRAGDPIAPDPAFLACAQQTSATSYCGRLAVALRMLSPQTPPRARGARPRIVAASLFTTLSATTWLEKARGDLQNSSLNLQRATPRAVFDVSDIAAFTLRLQERVSPPGFTDFVVPLPAALLAGVGRVGFGSFRSPNFLEDQTIPQSPTGAAVSLPAASNEIFFHAFLPSSPRPPSGYPVVIFGHGLNDSRFGAPTLVASTFARAGFATVAINAAGHGSGSESRVLLILTNGSTAEIRAGGRSIDLNGDGMVESAEGCLVIGPLNTGLRDCLRQTVVDLMQLARAVRIGVDVDGDGLPDLDRNRVYYAGQSLGALYGTIFTAIEPDVRAAALNAGGASAVNIARWSLEFRHFARSFLSDRTPPLLNRPGDFDDNYVLRDRPAKINDVPGAIEIQNLFETLEWLHVSGDPMAYAPHLKVSPLAGVGPKPVLWQFASTDRTVPNPQTSHLIRAAGMRESSQLYRHDLARLTATELPQNPHAYLVEVRSTAGILIAQATQSQIAGFFESDGSVIPNANSLAVRLLFGRNLFEVPGSLPEELGF